MNCSNNYDAHSLDKIALDTFVRSPVSESMIQYLASATLMTIKCDPVNQSTPPASPNSKPELLVAEPTISSLGVFIKTLVKRSNVQTPTLMTSLVYLARLRDRLPPSAMGMSCTCHRIFLASLILAAKNLNDSSPKNKYWARYTAGLFTVADVNLMEIQLLYLLDWDMRVTNRDLYIHFNPFLAPIKDKMLANKVSSQVYNTPPGSDSVFLSSPNSQVSAIRPLRVKQRLNTPPELSASSSLDSLSSIDSNCVLTPNEAQRNPKFVYNNKSTSRTQGKRSDTSVYIKKDLHPGMLEVSLLDPRTSVYNEPAF
ncbi:Pcl1 protein [Starmerella bacillaris]|uniref:Pcl1 protein n=1 Tax=Starmerella bacillaris TaxID=1247836 RepID=A0AAV5RIL1_STABA|nr:Pcl1 protein [Starmerella bacillaris]